MARRVRRNGGRARRRRNGNGRSTIITRALSPSNAGFCLSAVGANLAHLTTASSSALAKARLTDGNSWLIVILTWLKKFFAKIGFLKSFSDVFFEWCISNPLSVIIVLWSWLVINISSFRRVLVLYAIVPLVLYFNPAIPEIVLPFIGFSLIFLFLTTRMPRWEMITILILAGLLLWQSS